MKQFKEQNFLEQYNQYVFFYNGFLSNWVDVTIVEYQK